MPALQNSAFLCALNLEAHPALMQQLPLQLTERRLWRRRPHSSGLAGRPTGASLPLARALSGPSTSASALSETGAQHQRGVTFAGGRPRRVDRTRLQAVHARVRRIACVGARA